MASMSIPSTADRVSQHTDEAVNRWILSIMERSVSRYIGRPRSEIGPRLNELEKEWDIERALEANASAVGLLGVALAAAFNRKWLFLSAIAGGFLMMHSIQGWCPPLALLRRFGFRTSREIESERMALKALRGDFRGVEVKARDARELLEAVDPTLYHHV